MQGLINHLISKHIILNQKGSYRQKFIAQSRDNNAAENTFVKVSISKESKSVFEEGKVILIDKPMHWTSFDVVKKIRAAIQVKKVGHAGTLDPLATGLLIICTGKFTKKINEFMSQTKGYSGTFTLGATTPTYDLESTPENKKDISLITEKIINDTVVNFIGEIDQVPPIYSAIKKNGTPLYELARKGEEVELKARKITIHAFEITSIKLPIVEFEITCSTGTYIRSIAHDFGNTIGCGAYLSSLRRTSIGDFKIKEAPSVEDFLKSLN